jgi:hypothetical protein
MRYVKNRSTVHHSLDIALVLTEDQDVNRGQPEMQL